MQGEKRKSKKKEDEEENGQQFYNAKYIYRKNGHIFKQVPTERIESIHKKRNQSKQGISVFWDEQLVAAEVFS